MEIAADNIDMLGTSVVRFLHSLRHG